MTAHFCIYLGFSRLCILGAYSKVILFKFINWVEFEVSERQKVIYVELKTEQNEIKKCK